MKAELRTLAIELRKEGKSYSQIRSLLQDKVAKSTLSYWCADVPLSVDQQKQLSERALKGIARAQMLARLKKAEYRQRRIDEIRNNLKSLPLFLENQHIGKIALAILFATEGSKTNKGSLTFGNSDPYLVALFLKLLRSCYNIDEKRFRGTLQCRADQDVDTLQFFWQKVTEIPPQQFYKPRIDPRTIGRPSRKKEYKGVCRIDYFSAGLYNELTLLNELIKESVSGPVV